MSQNTLRLATAGVVAPASGEGIYYAMVCGRFVAEAAEAFCATGEARALRTARKRFMKAQASGDTTQMIVHIEDFFKAVMDPAEVDEFLALEDDGEVMTYQRFSALVAFVAEQVLGNPTKSPGTSLAGRRTTRSTSRDASPKAVVWTLASGSSLQDRLERIKSPCTLPS